MSRAHRYIVNSRYYHVTHRCHDRAFLLKFVRDKDAYRRLLRQRLQETRVDLMGYCLTDNHVHLLLAVPEKERMARLMQLVAGDFAQAYNRRKRRSGAFWGDRYHAVAVEGAEHLWNGLLYIDLNMVRAGVVEHPSAWPWCSYGELSGQRKRYRLVNQELLAHALGPQRNPTRLTEAYVQTVDDCIARRALHREAMWTETLAVGSQTFVRRVEQELKNKKQREILEEDEKSGTWILREPRLKYA